MPCQPERIAELQVALAEVPELVLRKMFGEYGLYSRGKLIGLVCDDVLFLKPTPGLVGLLDEPQLMPPYGGAKPHLAFPPETWQGRIDFPKLCARIWDELPAPKSKKPAPKKATRRKPGASD